MRRNAVRALCLLPWVGLAAARVAFGYRRLGLDELPAWLSGVSPLPRPLRDPIVAGALVSRTASFLPPRRMGRCLKRSLILLDLWSRCGLEPELHLGVKKAGDTRLYHAWLTARGCPAPLSEDTSFAEIFTQPARSSK